MKEPGSGKQINFLDGYQLVSVRSGYNNEIGIWEQPEKPRIVTRKLREMGSEYADLSVLSPSLSPDKLEKEFVLLRFLEGRHLPIARCLYHEPSISVYEWAAGKELDFEEFKQHPIKQRVTMGTNLGGFLGKFHNSQKSSEGQKLINQVPGQFGHTTLREKHLWRLDSSIRYLEQQGAIDGDTAKRVRTLGTSRINQVPETSFRVIHGDLYSRNIFIDPNNFDITAVIDWIDASEVDDPYADLLLTARWYGFNDDLTDLDLQSNRDSFYSVIRGYEDLTHTKVEQDPLELFKTYDLLWHMRVLVAEQAKRNNQIVKQFGATLHNLLKQM